MKKSTLGGWILAGFRGITWRAALALVCCLIPSSNRGATNVYLTNVPDYEWHIGCFGTASGNLMGFWDRHGFPNFYTGPTGDGVAPLTSYGGNVGIRSLWASQAGLDGRLSSSPGHVDDYFVAYASTLPDPHATASRPEHQPDCLGDFIGLGQRKWTNMNGECDGNIDGYSFVYWDSSGYRRVNFTPGPEAGLPAIDIQSGLRSWTQYRGYTADVFTQLSDLNPEVPPGKGFTFEDLKAEIDAGYPVLMFLQDVRGKWRDFSDAARINPLIHGILAYGYLIGEDGTQHVRYRSSFASGDSQFGIWNSNTIWHSIAPLRGVIGYHPQPQITSVTEEGGQITVHWHGPNAELYDGISGVSTKVHRYVLEKTASLAEPDYSPVADPTTENNVTVGATEERGFYRLRLLPAPERQE